MAPALSRRQWAAGQSVLLAMLCAMVTGCTSPMFARYPQWGINHPTSEGRAFEQQDPFPDPDIGPDLMSRPRDFARPRTEARRAAEQRLFQGAPAPQGSYNPGNPRGGLRRPAAVY